jgi:hypothetical protein
MTRIRSFLRRVLRMAKALATDKRVPRLVRPLIVAGLLPIPGPVDEVFLFLALILLMILRPGLIATLWREAHLNPDDVILG